MQGINNIWKKLSTIPEINKNKEFQRKNIVIKEAQKENSIINKAIGINEDNLFDNETKNNKNLHFVNKKRGRKKLKNGNIEDNNSAHNKFSHDNIKRKVKTHFHIFIIALLNMKSEKILSKKNRFGKISSSVTQNITVDYNQKLFDKKIREIIIEISNKFQDKNKNIISLDIVNRRAQPYEEIIQLLNMTYKDMYLNYYLKSNKETFKDEASDESYESHLKKLEKLYGKEYIFDYKRNAQELISFFYKIKKRVRNKQSKELIKPQFCHFNNSNLDHNYININSNDSNYLISPKKMTSTSTQTDMIVSEDEDENFIKNILELDLPPL